MAGMSLEYQRAYRVKNRERLTAYKRAYFQKNKARIQAQGRVQYIKDRDAILVRGKAYRDSHKLQRRAKRVVATLAKYGVTPEWFAETMAEQGGACAICRTPLLGRGRAYDAPAVDHDHASGLARGILCSHCNRGLGLFRESPARLMAAMHYVWRTNEAKEVAA